MAGRVPRCRDNHHASVAEYVVVAFKLRHRVLRLEATAAGRARPIVFSLLHQQHGLREQLHVTDVVRVCVGDSDEFNVRWPDGELIELARERFRPTPMYSLRISRSLPVSHLGDPLTTPAIPQQPTPPQVI